MAADCAATASPPVSSLSPDSAGATLTVSVVHALPDRAWDVTLQVPAGATLAQVVAQSGFLQQFPDHDLSALTLGVFGQARPAGSPAADGDRIEIYRPLRFDPMESRRRRAEHRRRSQAAQAGRARAPVSS